MIDLLNFAESAPSAWPRIEGIDDPEFAATVWQRIEQYTNYRWPARRVEFALQGQGEFTPLVTPFKPESIKCWSAQKWRVAQMLKTAWCGVCLPFDTQWRLEGIAGDDSVPPAEVLEAARRLSDYFCQIQNDGRTMSATSLSGDDASVDLGAAWAAKAVQRSGAGDLLRRYRRLG